LSLLYEEERYEIAETIDVVMMMKFLYDLGEDYITDKHQSINGEDFFLRAITRLEHRFRFFRAKNEPDTPHCYEIAFLFDWTMIPEILVSQVKETIKNAVQTSGLYYEDFEGDWQEDGYFTIEYYSTPMFSSLLSNLWMALSQIQQDIQKATQNTQESLSSSMQEGLL